MASSMFAAFSLLLLCTICIIVQADIGSGCNGRACRAQSGLNCDPGCECVPDTPPSTKGQSFFGSCVPAVNRHKIKCKSHADCSTFGGAHHGETYYCSKLVGAPYGLCSTTTNS